MCHSCRDRQACTIIRNLTRGIIANHTNPLSTMQCIARQQLQYEGIWIITTLPSWTKHIITHRAAHVMICPHPSFRVGKYKTLIWSVDTLWDNWCQKWGKGGFLWFVFETHFDCSSSIFLPVATGHGNLNSSIPPPAWMWRPHTFSFGFFLSFRFFLRNLPGHFANFVRVGLRFSETSRLACLYLGHFETGLQNLFIALEGVQWRRGS